MLVSPVFTTHTLRPESGTERCEQAVAALPGKYDIVKIGRASCRERV